jgi:hypothetical protein
MHSPGYVTVRRDLFPLARQLTLQPIGDAMHSLKALQVPM